MATLSRAPSFETPSRSRRDQFEDVEFLFESTKYFQLNGTKKFPWTTVWMLGRYIFYNVMGRNLGRFLSRCSDAGKLRAETTKFLRRALRVLLECEFVSSILYWTISFILVSVVESVGSKNVVNKYKLQPLVDEVYEC